MKINPYYLSLIRKKDDAIWKQCVPDKMEELLGAPLPPLAEPLSEERVEALAHYRERTPLIELDTATLLEGLDISGEHLDIAMTQLQRCD